MAEASGVGPPATSQNAAQSVVKPNLGFVDT